MTEAVTGPRPGRAAAARRGGRAAGVRAGGRPASTATRSRCGSSPRTPRRASCRRAGVVTAFDRPRRRPRRHRASAPARRCRRTTTRCWPRSSRTARTAPRRSRRLADALDATRIEGVGDNVDLLAAVLDEPAFRAGDLHTGFLDEHGMVARLRRRPRRGDRRCGRRALARRADRSAGRRRCRRPVAGRRPVAPGPESASRCAGSRGGRVRTTRTSRGAGGRRRRRSRSTAAGSRRARTGGDAASGWSIEIGPDTALVRQAVAGRRVETVTWSGRRHRLALRHRPRRTRGRRRSPTRRTR